MTTVETLTINGWKVRVGKHEADFWEAVVVEVKNENPVAQAINAALNPSNAKWSTVQNTPQITTDRGKYTAAGIAIDELIQENSGDDDE